ncbi:hypothetical protein [Gilvimarinus chinensis]|uniref:hypothetical protein n=1 Tax=Gilvimarinus chinensis TaxID=396005 RepID=UPI00036F5CDB|nr:hypothetical protein [Gilvimarinus chinensis]
MLNKLGIRRRYLLKTEFGYQDNTGEGIWFNLYILVVWFGFIRYKKRIRAPVPYHVNLDKLLAKWNKRIEDQTPY